MKAGNPKKYEGLKISLAAQKLLKENPKLFASYCNGVGSKTGFWATLLWHITPNTIWSMNITDCTDLHDVDYSYPAAFKDEEEALAYKKAADERLYRNLLIRIEQHGGWFENLRKTRALAYFGIVSAAGTDPFLKGKVFVKTPLLNT